MKKLIAFAEMVDEMLKKLLPDALHIAVEKGAKVVGSSRCCIVLPVKNNRLVLHAGYPKEGHSVGQEVVGKHADFLKMLCIRIVAWCTYTIPRAIREHRT